MRGGSLLSKNLEYFAILYRMRNYSEAARAIPITYQGLKKAIKALEIETGVHLFETGAGGSLVPTAYGEELYEMTRSWMKNARDLENTFTHMHTEGRKAIGLGVARGVASIVGDEIEKEFELKYPSLAIDIIEYADEVVDDMLMWGDFDLAITTSPFSDDYQTIPLFSFKCCAWVYKDHPFADVDILSLSALEGETIMLPGQHYKTSKSFLKAFKEQDIKPKRIKYCSDIIHSFLFAINNEGIGIGMQPIADMLKGVELVVAVPLEDTVTRKFALSYRAGYSLEDSEQELANFMVQYFSKRNNY